MLEAGGTPALRRWLGFVAVADDVADAFQIGFGHGGAGGKAEAIAEDALANCAGTSVEVSKRGQGVDRRVRTVWITWYCSAVIIPG